MIQLEKMEVWFVAGAQHLYGPEALKTVAAHSESIAQGLGRARQIPVKVVCKPPMTTPEAIYDLCQEANAAPDCIGLIAWMHTFSPAKLDRRAASPPEAAGAPAHAVQPRHSLVHDRHGFHEPEPVGARRPRIWLHLEPDAAEAESGRRLLAGRGRAARLGAGRAPPAPGTTAQSAKIARFGDNMREVAVTEGDKVEAQMRAWLLASMATASATWCATCAGVGCRVDRSRKDYEAAVRGCRADLRAAARVTESVREAARIELGLRAFPRRRELQSLHRHVRGFARSGAVAGIAVQRLMADGYGFGAEGDWKTAALVRAMKVMAAGLERRHLVHGGLHLPFACRQAARCWARTCWKSARPLPR